MTRGSGALEGAEAGRDVGVAMQNYTALLDCQRRLSTSQCMHLRGFVTTRTAEWEERLSQTLKRCVLVVHVFTE